MKLFSIFIFLVSTAILLEAQDHQKDTSPSLPDYLKEDYDETGRPLPPGVPRSVDTNGVITYIPHRFTTSAYRSEALKLVIQEANKVAKELELREEMPITESNMAGYHIGPFGFNYAYRSVGSVTTKHYIYYVSKNNRFSDLTVADYDKTCNAFRNKGEIPITQLDTNAAYQLATQWLYTAHMDVAGLNRDCKVTIKVNEFWNGLMPDARPGKQFVPIYDVDWLSAQNQAEHSGDAAFAELYLPTRSLIQFSVRDPKYILRPPIVFTNLARLFPGVAPIHTNYPVPPVYMSAPPP